MKKYFMLEPIPRLSIPSSLQLCIRWSAAQGYTVRVEIFSLKGRTFIAGYVNGFLTHSASVARAVGINIRPCYRLRSLYTWIFQRAGSAVLDFRRLRINEYPWFNSFLLSRFSIPSRSTFAPHHLPVYSDSSLAMFVYFADRLLH